VEIVLRSGGSVPDYPYHKVVVAGDEAEVAPVPSEERSENALYHEDVFTLLCRRRPEIDERSADYAPGWLAQRGDEGLLHILPAGAEISAADAMRIGEALSEWCRLAGISTLTITGLNIGPCVAEPMDSDWRFT
jgi:hypothetical protein